MQRPHDEETKEPIPPPRPVVLMAFDCAVCCGRPDVSCGACGHTAGQPRPPLKAREAARKFAESAVPIGSSSLPAPSIPVASAEFAMLVNHMVAERRKCGPEFLQAMREGLRPDYEGRPVNDRAFLGILASGVAARIVAAESLTPVAEGKADESE